jgi:hypothetical protein
MKAPKVRPHISLRQSPESDAPGITVSKDPALKGQASKNAMFA